MPLLLEAILESPEIAQYIAQRNLLSQYKKAKAYILSGNFTAVHFKKKEPKSLNIWYFRINKQFRAIGYLKDTTLFIIEIDNHQNT